MCFIWSRTISRVKRAIKLDVYVLLSGSQREGVELDAFIHRDEIDTQNG